MESALCCFCLKDFSFQASKMPSAELGELEKTLSLYGQEHLLEFWPRLSAEQRTNLVRDIQSIDFQTVQRALEESMKDKENSQKLDELLQPIPEDLHEGVSLCTPDQLRQYKEEGLRQISEGKVAALLLAGGQGTRLGVQHPKGMYDVGLPSHKTLYQLQGERLLKLQELALEFTGKRGSIPWYIMTSEHTMDATVDFFAKHQYFGLEKDDLIVFEQFMLPCVTFEGKIILETPSKIAKAPDGNGGLFRALQNRGILKDMVRRGVRYVHVYCVDNILVKMADPVFIGYCIRKNADCAAKVVEKVSPTESVGVVCRVDGKFQVVEYSEISLETAQKRNSEGRLIFNAGNICNHFFSVEFLNQIGSGQKRLKHHVAKKKIPYVGSDGKIVRPLKPNGIKLEKFVFDVFVFSDKFAAWEVSRSEEFSPLKNADTSEKDTPTTARQALYSLHRRYIEEAGGRFSDENRNTHLSGDEMNGTNGTMDPIGVCEISPLVSYAGEGLEDIVRGKVFTFPLTLTSSKEQARLYSE